MYLRLIKLMVHLLVLRHVSSEVCFVATENGENEECQCHSAVPQLPKAPRFFLNGTTDSPTTQTTTRRRTTTAQTPTQSSTSADATTSRSTTASLSCGDDKCDPWTEKCDESSMQCVCRFGYIEPCLDPCFGQCDRSVQSCVESDLGFECQPQQLFQSEEIAISHDIPHKNKAKRDAAMILEEDSDGSSDLEVNMKLLFALTGICLGGMATSAAIFIAVIRSYRKASRQRLLSFRDGGCNSK